MAVAPKGQGLLPFAVPVGYSDETWVETLSARLVRDSVVRAIASGKPERLWVCGGAGVGKTHSMVHFVGALDGVYVHASTLTPGELDVMLDTQASPTWVVIDDVEHWLGDRQDEEALFSLWKRYQCTIVLTARQSPHRFTWLLPDLQSRAQSALVLPFARLTDTELQAVLVRHCTARGLVLGEDALAFLTVQMPRHPAPLIRWIERIDRRSLEAQRRLTIPWIRSVLPELRDLQNTE